MLKHFFKQIKNKQYVTKLLTISVLCIVCTISCKSDYNTFNILNNSSHNIVIKGFDRIGEYYGKFFTQDSITANTAIETINIKRQSEYSTTKEIDNFGFDNKRSIFNDSQIDSISIEFDSLRYITFASKGARGFAAADTAHPNAKYNFLNYFETSDCIENKQVLGLSIQRNKCTFIFTDEDYEKAKKF